MTASYPIRFPAQLRQHLRALRKKRGLTQANVAALIGVSQARVAEIEANPGLVSFEQMIQILAAIGATVTLSEAPPLLDNKKNAPQSDTTAAGQARTTRTPQRDSDVEQARAALETLEANSGLYTIRKALEAHSGPEEMRKALYSIGGLEQARKALGAGSASELLKASEELNSLKSYRNVLAHSKKGGW